MIKLFEKYLNSKKLKIVNQKEQEKIAEFRKTRSELKQVIDDYNDILFLFLHKCSIKELKNFNNSIVIINLSKIKNNNRFKERTNNETFRILEGISIVLNVKFIVYEIKKER